MDPKLIKVAREGNIHGLKQLIKERDPSILLNQITPVVDQITPVGNTLLHIAAMFEHSDFLLEVCVRFPSLIFKTNLNGDTALHVGARAGRLAVINHLIDRMCSCSFVMNNEDGSTKAVYLLGIQNHKGDTVLHEALRYCHPDVAQLLIQKCPDLCHIVNKASESPLYVAVTKRYSDIVDQILRCSSSPACGGPKGWTALHASIAVDASSLVERTLRTNVEGSTIVDINRTGEQRVIVGHYMTKKLLEVKPELARVEDIYGRTPLHYAVLMEEPSYMVRLLLQHDASLAYLRDREYGWSPLHVFAASHKIRDLLSVEDIVKDIIELCPDLEYQLDNRGNNFLHVLIKESTQRRFTLTYIKISELLLRKKIPWEVVLNQPNNDGNTPLHLATLSRSKCWVRALTKDERVDRTATNNANLTAFDIACRQFHKTRRHRKEWFEIMEDIRLHETYSSFSGVWIETLEPDFELTVAKEDQDQDQDHEKRETEKEEDREFRKLSKNHMLVATLIATVAFGAALQIPGGYESGDGDKRGMATLAGEAAFGAFVISDVIALSCSLLTLLLYFFANILFLDDKIRLRVVIIPLFLILVAIVAMIVAFMCGVFAVLVKTHSLWIGILTIALCLSVPFIGCSLSFWQARHRYED